MKNKPSLLSIAISLSIANSVSLLLLLALLALSVHQAYASSCFTDTGGNWAEPFICWMKTIGITSGYADGSFKPGNNITRAEVAALLYKEASGDTYVNLGPNAWQVNASSIGSAYIDYWTGLDDLQSNATGHNFYEVSLPLITALHNQQMTAKGVKLCYDATATAGGSIYAVGVSVYDGADNQLRTIYDTTPRKDQTCRLYSFSSPVALASTDSLVVIVTTNLVSTSDFVDVFGTTAIEGFSPTAGVLAPSLGDAGPVPPSAP